MSQREAVILCEGYDDRAFWAGYLTHVGCQEQRSDPWGEAVKGGDFGFCSGGQFIRVRPVYGKDNVLNAATARLKQQRTKPVSCLVLSVDDDTVGGDGQQTLPLAAVRDRLRRERHEATQGFPSFGEPTEGEFVTADGLPRIYTVRWACDDAPAAGLPAKQTLERLVCAALNEVYPDRAEPLQKWLDSRPDPVDSVKAFAWSHMAGWYPDDGCQYFYERLWQDGDVAKALLSRLESTLAPAVVAALCGS